MCNGDVQIIYFYLPNGVSVVWRNLHCVVVFSDLMPHMTFPVVLLCEV